MYFSPYSMISRSPIINVLIIISIIITLWASWHVKSKIKKYSHSFSSKYTGLELAQNMLKDSNISDVKIIEGNFNLGGEYYDPRNKTIVLSNEAINYNSVSATAIVAHEVGHAIQKNENHTFSMFRNVLVGPVNFISKVSYFIMIFGFIGTFAYRSFDYTPIIYISAMGIGASLIFQLVTLPVEFDASKRALTYLSNSSIYVTGNINESRIVLRAAALTYVAAAASTLIELLRILSFLNSDD